MGRLNRPRVFGRHLMGTAPQSCTQQISIVMPNETLSKPEMYREEIVVASYSETQMIARSPFGAFVYSKEYQGEVADLLITLAGQIRRAM